jgi:DNA polymerase-3 subunit delta'
MLPTIRSRVRRITLKTPAVEEVAQLLVERDSIDYALALVVAAEAQSHIGMARRLATSADARGRRKDTLVAALAIDTVATAIFTAERWIELARRDADALTAERDSAEREELLRVLGVEDTSKLPPYARADVKALEETQKRRATRSLRDGLDRILVDLLSLYRDILMFQLEAEVPLDNESLKPQLVSIAQRSSAQQTLEKLNQIELARTRIAANVKDLIVLEALAVNLRTKP